MLKRRDCLIAQKNQRSLVLQKYLMFLLILIIFLVSSLSVLGVEVEKKVLEELEEKGEVSVIVMLKDEPVKEVKGLRVVSVDRERGLETKRETVKKVQEEVLNRLKVKEASDLSTVSVEEGYDFELEYKYSMINGFSGRISKKGLEKLKNDRKVEKIFFNHPIKPILSNSVPLIKANYVWNISVNGLPINGSGQTVCVIDTGIDYTHPALGGCTNDSFLNGSCSKVIGGYDFGDNDNDPIDVNGHGTHVAGIVASENGTYKGVAPGAKLVALKVFDNAGNGSISWALSGIDWCVNNASIFNISVITMSIAVTDAQNNEILYSTHCDANQALAAKASWAASQGIFVSAAAGNAGNASGIAAPACGENVTSVGAVYDANVGSMTYPGVCTDAVTAADQIACFSNSGSILDLLAPGSEIKSTVLNAAFDSYRGTSMATPHVAGAAALMIQYWKRAYNLTPFPSQIENKLKIAGKLINDTRNGILFPRINVLKTIQPFINFTANSPSNSTIISTTFALINITSDVNLSAALLEWDFHNGTIINFTMNKSNNTNFYYNLSNLASAAYSYKVYGNDSANTFGETETRILTVDALPLAIQLNYPGNGTNLTNSLVNFNWTVIDNFDTNLTCNLTINNLVNLSDYSSLNNTPTNYTLNLSEAVYYWNITCWDDLNNTNTSETRVFTLNAAPPEISFFNPQNNSYHKEKFNLNISITDVLLSSSLYNISNSSGNLVQQNSNSNINSNPFFWNDLVNISNSTFNDGGYALTVFANDSINAVTIKAINFIVDKTNPSILNITQSPSIVYNNDTIIFTINLSETNLNLSAVFLEANWTGNWINYSMVLEVNSSPHYKFNFSVSGTQNLTNQKNIAYHFHIFDLAGNYNSTEIFNFTVQNRLPLVNITQPANNSLFELGENVFFSASVIDHDNDSLTYFWNFGDGHNSTSLNTSHQYNLSGHYNVTLNVSDGISYSPQTIYNLTVRDTTAPNITFISYFPEIRLNNNQTINATVFDYTNLSSVILYFNNLVIPPTENTTNNYFWIINSSLINSSGSKNFTIETKDTFNNSLNRTYKFSVTSCDDGIQNGQETGVDCGGDCPSCSAGSPGGGGGGIITKKQCQDNLDNDKDGKIDYPDDLGCENALDDDETDLTCQENWVCDAWSECKDNKQTRTCQEINQCQEKLKQRKVAKILTVSKPKEEQSCEVKKPEETKKEVAIKEEKTIEEEKELIKKETGEEKKEIKKESLAGKAISFGFKEKKARVALILFVLVIILVVLTFWLSKRKNQDL